VYRTTQEARDKAMEITHNWRKTYSYPLTNEKRPPMRARAMLIRCMFPAEARVLVLGVLIAGAFGVAAHQRTPMLTPQSLTNAIPDDVSRVAIAYTTSHFQMLATPQVLLNRPPSKAEVTTLGLGDLTMNTIKQPPLTLVILTGARFSPVVRSPRPHRVAARSVFPARTRSPAP